MTKASLEHIPRQSQDDLWFNANDPGRFVYVESVGTFCIISINEDGTAWAQRGHKTIVIEATRISDPRAGYIVTSAKTLQCSAL